MFTRFFKGIRLLFRKNKEPYSSFYKILGFYPDNIHLYEQALLHKSSSVEVEKGKWLNNERMEFLGDAILDAIVADVVYTAFPNKREGFLTNTRSKIVSRETLNRVAIKLGLDKFIVYSIKLNNHNKCIYGNALEAFIAAIYLDQGYDTCKRFVCEKMIRNHLNIFDMAQKEVNFKSNLIEWSQKNKIGISFDLIESFTDKEGNPVFQTRVTIAGEQAGVGIGYSKKESQQNAAKMAVKKLRTDKEFQQHVIELKKHRTGENTETREFDELPEDEHESDLRADALPAGASGCDCAEEPEMAESGLSFSGDEVSGCDDRTENCAEEPEPGQPDQAACGISGQVIPGEEPVYSGGYQEEPEHCREEPEINAVEPAVVSAPEKAVVAGEAAPAPLPASEPEQNGLPAENEKTLPAIALEPAAGMAAESKDVLPADGAPTAGSCEK